LYFQIHFIGENMFNSKVFLAEFIGIFGLVFVGMTAGLVGNNDLAGLAIVYGLTMAVFVYTYGRISGAHLNPAVTFGLALNGTVKWLQAVFYWLAQFAGAILAVFFFKTVLESLGGDVSRVVPIGALTESQPILAMVVEAILAFFLVNTVLHTMVAEKGGAFAGVAIGAALSMVAVVGILFTGDIVNPARTLASAIFAGPSLTTVYTYVIYLFGPLLGSTLAVIVFNFLKDTVEEEVEDEADDEVEEKDAEPAG
jgi:glycerol uptake facilitator-like aquaporin